MAVLIYGTGVYGIDHWGPEMVSQGQVNSINGQTLGAGAFASVTANVIEGGDDVNADPQFLDRAGLPPEFVQSGVNAHAIDVSFKVPTYADKALVLASLDYPNSEQTSELQAYWGDPNDPTLCTADVALDRIKVSPGDVLVTFAKRAAAWMAVTLADLGRTLSFTATSAATLINKGHVRTPAYLKLGWSVQRTTSTSATGWRFRHQVTITNNTTEDWEDELMSVDAGDTAAWVTATEAQADGDDVRVWFEGREVYRTLTCFNTKRTQIHFLISLKAGASATYDVVYGNASANAPRTMSTKGATRKTYAAPDLEGTSGTATSGSTSTLTDSGKAWETNRWKGGWIGLLSGTGSIRWRRVASNTSTAITFNRTVGIAPASGTTYVIFMSGIYFDGGIISGGVTSTAIQDTDHTRKFGVNSLVGATVTFHDSTANPATMVVKSNTADTITFTTSFTTNPTVGNHFTIQRQGVWSYVVNKALFETVHRGMYRENLYFGAPTRTWPNGDTPAGWQTETYLPNDDLYGVYPAYNEGSGGGHNNNYWPLLRAYRRVKRDGKFTGQGVGDGFSLFSAFSFQGWYFDYFWRNINGVGKATFSTMDVGGQDWQDVVTNTTTEAINVVVAAQHVDLTDANFPTRLYMGVLPTDGVAVPVGEGQANQIELQTKTVLEVYHYLTSFGGLASSIYSLGSKVECYEVSASLRIGGGRDAERTAPFEEIVLGGSGHYVMLPTTHELWIATNPGPNTPLFAVYTSAGVRQYVAAWAGKIYHHILDSSGVDVAVQSREFGMIPPAINMITNGYFGSNITGWTPGYSAGVTATTTWKSTPDAGDGIGVGSMEIDITAAPAGAWSVTITWPQIAVIPGKNYPLGFAYRATNIGSSLAVYMRAFWEGQVGGDPDTTLGGPPTAINTWYYAADDEVTFKVEPGLVSSFASTDTVDINIFISGTGSYVGKIYVDQITLGVPNIHVTQLAAGTATLKASWQEGFLS